MNYDKGGGKLSNFNISDFLYFVHGNGFFIIKIDNLPASVFNSQRSKC